jgi:hypothetical protein
MIECKKCNTKNEDGARFCKECGAAFIRNNPVVWVYIFMLFFLLFMAFTFQEFEQIADIFDAVGEYWSRNEIL